MIVAPSILASKKETLIGDTSALFSFGAKWVHIDIMDGIFVPNMTFKPDVVESLKKGVPGMFRDVHLMVVDVAKEILEFALAGAESITFHLEACKDEDEVLSYIKAIHNLGLKAGLSLKPNTKAEALLPYLKDIDLVLVMSVEPGFGGQKFMESSLPKIAFFDRYRKYNKLNYQIEVDGGINQETGEKCAKEGVDILVAGSYLYGKEDANSRIKELLKL